MLPHFFIGLNDVLADDGLDFYRRWSVTEASLPVFSKGWWLDSVCPSSWSAVVIHKGGSVEACLPYCEERIGPFRLLRQPLLTQNLGPWISESDGRYSKQLAREKDLMEALIDGLPNYDGFAQSWHYSRTNWLPFYWRNFSQTTRYTYVLEGLSNFEAIVSQFEHSKRKNIRKAEGIVKVSWDIGADEFFNNHEMTLKKQGQPISYSRDVFNRIYNSSYREGMGRSIGAYDRSGNLHAALFIIFDSMSAYDLISTIDPEYRISGAASLLVKEAIRYTAERGLDRFDFEGSMIESVERSFRQFGAQQKAYHRVRHIPSMTLRAIHGMRAFTKACLDNDRDKR